MDMDGDAFMLLNDKTMEAMIKSQGLLLKLKSKFGKLSQQNTKELVEGSAAVMSTLRRKSVVKVFQNGMKRMQVLRLMPSITYFHKRMDELDLDYDKEILGVFKSASDTGKENKDPANEGKKILTSLAQIFSNDNLDAEPSSMQKKLLVFPHRKPANIVDSVDDVESTESMDCTLTTVANAAEEVSDKTIPPDNGRKLVLDNVDFHQLTHDMTEQHQNPDAHFCSLMATENRVSGNHLSDDEPICTLMDMENGKCCPSQWEYKLQHDNYIQLVSRVLTQELPCLHFLREVVFSHIPHQYSINMKQKTETTFLGILYENENVADGFRKILNHLQQFVPSYFDGKKDTCGEQAVVGDQITVERGVNSSMEVSNGFTPEERNEGIHSEIADFPGGMKFLE
ncbi:Hypothetical predicted protein, partial [Paramuricea clavata]